DWSSDVCSSDLHSQPVDGSDFFYPHPIIFIYNPKTISFQLPFHTKYSIPLISPHIPLIQLERPFHTVARDVSALKQSRQAQSNLKLYIRHVHQMPQTKHRQLKTQ